MMSKELKIGDRVFIKGYIKEVEVEGIDDLKRLSKTKQR